MKNDRRKELVRFLICGIAAALTDYLFCQLVILIFNSANISIPWIWLTVISTAIGFIFGVLVNYLLSTYWVYQNVDKSIQTKSVKFITLFVIFSLIAMLLSIATMLLCNLVIMKGLHQASIMDVSLMNLIKEYGMSFLAQVSFWTYFISFCLKTFVGLVFNYFTRKYILYKEPKEKAL